MIRSNCNFIIFILGNIRECPSYRVHHFKQEKSVRSLFLPLSVRNSALLLHRRPFIGSPNMVAVTFGGPPLTRMPSQTFNLGHEAARESDHRFSALRNCGKDRREQNVQKKKEGEKERERKRENISWKIFNVPFVFLSPSLSRRISSISRRNPSKLKLGPNYQSMFDLSIIPVSTRNITPTVPTSIAISTVQISKKPVSYRRMIHRRDSPCSPRR